MSETLTATALTPRGRAWLASTQLPRVLHVFSPVVNLINEQGAVLSLNIPALGHAPFALTLDRPLDLQRHVTATSVAHLTAERLQVGALDIDLTSAAEWTPRPNWQAAATSPAVLSARIAAILAHEAPPDSIAHALQPDASSSDRLQTRFFEKARAAVSQLGSGLQHDNADDVSAGATQLAGLGVGLTPAGDDFLIGVMHGLWLRLPASEAARIASAIHAAAAERTNALSAAWLAAAADGDAGEVWHELLAAPETDLDAVIRRILPTGHTSGADALAGFRHLLELELRA